RGRGDHRDPPHRPLAPRGPRLGRGGDRAAPLPPSRHGGGRGHAGWRPRRLAALPPRRGPPAVRVRPNRGRERPPPPPLAAGPPPPGRPLPRLGGALTRVPRGARGEFCLGEPALARGYVGRPDSTALAFVPDPWSGAPGARLYRTGDLARRRGDGAIE